MEEGDVFSTLCRNQDLAIHFVVQICTIALKSRKSEETAETCEMRYISSEGHSSKGKVAIDVSLQEGLLLETSVTTLLGWWWHSGGARVSPL